MTIQAHNLKILQQHKAALTFMKISRETSEKSKYDRITAIMNKLRSGQKLSDGELAMLRKVSPELYASATQIMSKWEREEKEKIEQIERIEQSREERAIEENKRDERNREIREDDRKRDRFIRD
jgi:hypothetical protein